MTSPETPRRTALGILLDAPHADVASWVKRHLIDASERPFEAVIPLVHRRQPEGFTAYVIALWADPSDDVAAALDRFVGSLDASALAPVRRIDEMKLQVALDMFYPLRGGASAERSLIQSIEYVASFPETREEYYGIQTVFSGPAMRRLHQADRNGRFIGFELVRRLHDTDGLPDLDIVHVSGFSFLQALKGMPHFFPAFEAAAKEIGLPSGRAIMKGWDQQRTKRTLRVRQLPEATLSSAKLESTPDSGP